MEEPFIMDPTHEWFQTQMPGFNVPLDAAPAVSFIMSHAMFKRES